MIKGKQVETNGRRDTEHFGGMACLFNKTKIHYIMSNENRKRVNVWMVVGVIVLIVLLFGWLTCADMAGDTDVSSSTNFATDNPAAPANQPTQVLD